MKIYLRKIGLKNKKIQALYKEKILHKSLKSTLKKLDKRKRLYYNTTVSRKTGKVSRNCFDELAESCG